MQIGSALLAALFCLIFVIFYATQREPSTTNKRALRREIEVPTLVANMSEGTSFFVPHRVAGQIVAGQVSAQKGDGSS